MIIAVDFDATVVEFAYPDVGKDIGAQPVLRDLVSKGHKIILYTMRSGKELADAVEWYRKNDIVLYGIQQNPEQRRWTDSPKCHADLYIDDCALGCPITRIGKSRGYVDWVRVREILEMDNVL